MSSQEYQPKQMVTPTSGKSRTVALILCVILGIIGIHRFYVGKPVSGFFYLITLGFLGIGWIIDIIMIVSGSFKDNVGALVTVW